MDTSLNKTPTVGSCRCSVIFFETLYITDTSLDKTPRDGPWHSSAIFFDPLQDRHLPKPDTKRLVPAVLQLFSWTLYKTHPLLQINYVKKC